MITWKRYLETKFFQRKINKFFKIYHQTSSIVEFKTVQKTWKHVCKNCPFLQFFITQMWHDLKWRDGDDKWNKEKNFSLKRLALALVVLQLMCAACSSVWPQNKSPWLEQKLDDKMSTWMNFDFCWHLQQCRELFFKTFFTMPWYLLIKWSVCK